MKDGHHASDALTQKDKQIAELEAELRRRSEWHHPACRKLMYDIGSSPCTCEQEYKSENATLSAERERLSEALTAIKNLVVGDKRPNWDGIVATTVTRNLIADYCDAAMPKPPPETT